MNKDEFLVIKRHSLNISPAGKRSLVAAIHHNKRDYAEPNGNFDSAQSGANISLPGLPSDFDAVMKLKSETEDAWKCRQRANATVAVEVVFSLREWRPGFDKIAYFSGAAKWVEQWYQGRLLCADVHLDEEHPHCHAIVLLNTGRDRPGGSDQVGYRNELQALVKAFHAEHAAAYGLKAPQPAVSRAKRMADARFIHQHLRATGHPAIGAAGWAFFAACIDRDAAAAARELGIALPEGTTLHQLAASPGKGAKTASGEAARDRRVQVARTDSQPPQTQSEGAETLMGVSAAHRSSAMNSKPPSCVGVSVSGPIPQPLSSDPATTVSRLPADAKSSSRAVERSDPPQQRYTRERESDIPADWFNPETGEPVRRPAAAAGGAKSAANEWVAGKLAALGIAREATEATLW